MFIKSPVFYVLLLFGILVHSGCTKDDQITREISFNAPILLAELPISETSSETEYSAQFFQSGKQIYLFLKDFSTDNPINLYLYSENRGESWSRAVTISTNEPIGIIDNKMLVLGHSSTEIIISKSANGKEWSEKTIYKIEDNKYPGFLQVIGTTDNNGKIYIAVQKLIKATKPYRTHMTLLKSEDGGDSFSTGTLFEYNSDYFMKYRNITLSKNNISINGSYQTSKLFTLPIMLVSNDYGETFRIQQDRNFTSSAIDPSNENRVFYYNNTKVEGSTELRSYFIESKDFGTTQEPSPSESCGTLMFRSNNMLVKIDKSGLSQSDDYGKTWGKSEKTVTYSNLYGISHPGIIESPDQKLWVAWSKNHKLYLMKEQ